MIIDTDKHNCGNCKMWITVKPKIDHPQITTPATLTKCSADNGCNITGPKFYCANHQLDKGKL